MTSSNVNGNQLPLTTGTGDPSGYWSEIYNYANKEREPPLPHFGKLQVMNIVRLLNDIAIIKGQVENNHDTSPEQMDLLGQKMHHYGR